MIIVKVGGGAGIDLPAVVDDLSALAEPYLVVLGANAVRDNLAKRLGVERKVLTSLSGFDSIYSDSEAIDLLLMAYAGLANKRFVALCQQRGINAVGLSGLDGRVVVGKQNAGIRIRENGKNLLMHDLSGKPVCVNVGLLTWLLENGYVPVLSVPIIDERGIPLNSENDDIVAVLQRSLHAHTVIHLIEAGGFLSDSGRPESTVTTMTRETVADALTGAKGRMKRKLLSISRLLENGVERVIIADGRIASPIRCALAGEGTVIS